MGCLGDCPRTPVLPTGLPEPARSEQTLLGGTGLGILCWGHPMAALHLSLHHRVLCAHSSPLLNSHTSASRLLSNHLYHQTPLTPQQRSHLWPCQLLLPLAERQRTSGRRNEGWEERGKEAGKSFTPHGIPPPPRAGRAGHSLSRSLFGPARVIHHTDPLPGATALLPDVLSDALARESCLKLFTL